MAYRVQHDTFASNERNYKKNDKHASIFKLNAFYTLLNVDKMLFPVISFNEKEFIIL